MNTAHAQTGDTHRLLVAWEDGDPEIAEELIPRVYAELRRLAGAVSRGERPGHTLQPTALVHETFMRLSGQRPAAGWRGREHFFAIATRLMHRILLDHARRRRVQKRGGDAVTLRLDEVPDFAVDRPEELLALEEALAGLRAVDPFKAWIVELRFFGGFTEDETASIVDRSTSTVSRHWRLAKAWLYHELQRRRNHHPG